MKRYDIGASIEDNGLIRLDTYEDPEGEWVKWEDHKKAMAELTAELEDREPVQAPGQTPRGQKMPDTKNEWKYMAELYAQQIEDDKLTIAQLKQRINKLEQRGSHTKPSLGQ